MINPLHVIEGTINKALNKNEALVNARRLICSYCDFYKKENDSCTSCGCPLDKKARIERLHCPIKKW
jgi:hypothetical protein